MLEALQSVTAQNGDRVGKAEVCFDSWGDKICDSGAQKLRPCVGKNMSFKTTVRASTIKDFATGSVT